VHGELPLAGRCDRLNVKKSHGKGTSSDDEDDARKRLGGNNNNNGITKYEISFRVLNGQGRPCRSKVRYGRLLRVRCRC
jgi:hypothetical protein